MAIRFRFWNSVFRSCSTQVPKNGTWGRIESTPPYMYYVHKIDLTKDEQVEWDNITKRIGKAYARMKNSKKEKVDFENRIKMLLIERARITKSAENKATMAIDVISKHYGQNQRWIIYCDNHNTFAKMKSDTQSTSLPEISKSP